LLLELLVRLRPNLDPRAVALPRPSAARAACQAAGESVTCPTGWGRQHL